MESSFAKTVCALCGDAVLKQLYIIHVRFLCAKREKDEPLPAHISTMKVVRKPKKRGAEKGIVRRPGSMMDQLDSMSD